MKHWWLSIFLAGWVCGVLGASIGFGINHFQKRGETVSETENDQLNYFRDKLLIEMTGALRALLMKASEHSHNAVLRDACTEFDSQLDQRWPLGEATWYDGEKEEEYEDQTP